jgi:pilus assembly protein Flp/PilA
MEIAVDDRGKHLRRWPETTEETMNLVWKLWKDDQGQDVVEYALIAGLVSIVAYLLIKGTGTSVSTIWSNVNSDVAGAA